MRGQYLSGLNSKYEATVRIPLNYVGTKTGNRRKQIFLFSPKVTNPPMSTCKDHLLTQYILYICTKWGFIWDYFMTELFS